MYFTVTEFANKIGVSSNTLRLWDRQGRLTPHHVTEGGRRMYSEEQLKLYLNINGEGVESISQLDFDGKLNGVAFMDLPKEDMKIVIENFESDLLQLERSAKGVLGFMKYVYASKEG